MNFFNSDTFYIFRIKKNSVLRKSSKYIFFNQSILEDNIKIISIFVILLHVHCTRLFDEILRIRWSDITEENIQVSPSWFIVRRQKKKKRVVIGENKKFAK